MPVALRLPIRPAEQNHVIRLVRARGPHLRAAHQPAALHPLRPRPRRRQVRARIRLAHPDAERATARRNPRQERLPLRLRPMPQDARPRLPLRNPVVPHRRARRQHLLQHHIALQRRALMPAILLRPGHPQPAARTHRLAERRVGADPGLRPLLRRPLPQRIRQERPHLAPQRLRAGRGGGRCRKFQCHAVRPHAAVIADHNPSAPAPNMARPTTAFHSASLPNSSRHDHSRRVA